MTQPYDDHNTDAQKAFLASYTVMYHAAMQQSIIKKDRFDKKVFEKIKDMSQETRELLESEEATYIPNFSTLIEEVFYTFFKAVPLFEDESTLTHTAKFRKKMLEQMMQTAEYKNIKDAGSSGDEYSSILAANAVGHGFINRLSDETKKRLQKLKDTEKFNEQLKKDLADLQQQRQKATEPELQGQLDKEIQAAQEQEQQWQKATDKAADAIEEMIEELEDEARRAARAGLKDAAAEIGETQEALQIFGGNYGMAPGTGMESGNMQEKYNLAEQLRNNKKLRDISRLAGKFINIAMQKHRTKTIHPPDEVIGITTGNNLKLVLQRERMHLEQGELGEMIFFTKYLNKGLMQREMIGHEPQGQGPFLMYLDTSSSMTDPLSVHEKHQYSKEIWSKAVAIAIMQLAEREGRDFYVAHFSGRGAIKGWHFPKGKGTPAQMIEWCSHFFRGGTDFNIWMNDSIDVLSQTLYEKADIIVVTDGVGNITEAVKTTYMEAREAKKAHAYGILLPTPSDIKLFHADEKLQSVTDKVTTVFDLQDSAPAFTMLFNL